MLNVKLLDSTPFKLTACAVTTSRIKILSQRLQDLSAKIV
jgi:hypothetical protein